MKWKTEQVVSSISGRLLCEIGEVYEFLDWFLRAKLYTHQLPDAGRFALPYVLKQHPMMAGWIAAAEAENFDKDHWREFRDQMNKALGAWLQIRRLPPTVYRQPNPVEDAIRMVGADRVIVVEAPDAEIGGNR